MKPKNMIWLWFDKDAHEAVRFYAATFPDSKVTAVHEAPADYPSGKEGDVLTSQEETDRYWNAIVGHGGTESEGGWCKERWASPGRSPRAR